MNYHKKICFISLQLSDCLGQFANNIGGAEIQTWYILNYLSNKMSCTCITYATAHKIEKIPACEVLYLDRPQNKNSGISHVILIINLWRLLYLSASEIFYFRCSGWLLAMIVFYAKIFRKKVLFHAAHEHDLYPLENLIHLKKWERYMYVWAVKRVDKIICQTPAQQLLIKKNYPMLSHEIIPNFWPRLKKAPSEKPKQYITFVANFRTFKRPEWVLEIAKNNPQLKFKMIGQNYHDKGLAESIENFAASIPNVELTGPLPLAEVENILDETLILINSSLAEGFPNTYLQAFRRGIPVLTTFDPGLEIETHKLGKVVSTIDEMNDCIKRMVLDIKYFDPNEIKLKFESFYSEDAIGSKFEQVLIEVLDGQVRKCR